jgi:hypothetical protein
MKTSWHKLIVKTCRSVAGFALVAVLAQGKTERFEENESPEPTPAKIPWSLSKRLCEDEKDRQPWLQWLASVENSRCSREVSYDRKFEERKTF